MQKTMLSVKRSIFSTLCLIICLFIMSGCQSKPQAAVTQAVPTTIDQSGLPWSIIVVKWEVTNDLSGSQAAQQYNGDVVQIQYNEKPSDGKSFLLLDLSVTKQVAGASTFSWKNLYVKDSSGNHYARMENDTFLENYNFPRLKSTDLTLGENKGFACFEIPVDSAKGGLSLVYESTDESLELPLQ